MSAKFYQRLLVVLIAIAALGTTSLIILQVIREPALPFPSDDVSFPAPVFEMTDQNGNLVKSESLKGKVYLPAQHVMDFSSKKKR